MTKMNDQTNCADLRDPAVRVVLLPKDTNQHGTIFGGIILSYIDIAGGVEAHKHTNNAIVTAAMDKVEFKEPVRVGEVVSFYATTTRVGRTSISVHVDVEVNRQSKLIHVTSADLVFVSVDRNGRPTPV
jgi:acyl-CoA thioesterase YciA